MPQADEDVVFEAVRQNRVAMCFAAESLRHVLRLPHCCRSVFVEAAADTVPGVSQIDSGTW